MTDITSMEEAVADKKNSNWKRLLPLAAIAAALALFLALDGPQYITIDYLRENRSDLLAAVANNKVLVLLGFMGLYAVLTAISFPGASFLSIFGGFMFGTALGTFGIVLGATIGACAIFLMARYTFRDTLRQKAGNHIEKFEKGLKENEFSYLFILRLVPLFPFFVVNIVPGLFDVKLRNYAITTLLGIIPGSLVYASIGAGAGAVLDAGGELTLGGQMTQPKVIFPVIGLICLSLIPIIYKKISKKET